jgi:hypothetical protein
LEEELESELRKVCTLLFWRPVLIAQTQKYAGGDGGLSNGGAKEPTRARRAGSKAKILGHEHSSDKLAGGFGQTLAMYLLCEPHLAIGGATERTTEQPEAAGRKAAVRSIVINICSSPGCVLLGLSRKPMS